MEINYLEFILTFQVFFLVLIRVTGMFVIAPIFGRQNMPTYYKIGFSFFVALIITNTIPVDRLMTFNSVWEYAPLILQEFLVGLILGYIGYLVFAGIYIAGQLIDMKIGFGIVNIMDPLTNIQVPITANFYTTTTMLIFLISGGHHILINALHESYTLVGLGQASFTSLLLDDVIRLFASIFSIGFKIAAPIIGAVMVADIALGIITKTVPQLNVFVVGMPLKILLGLIIIFITVPSFIGIVDFMIRGIDSEMYVFLKSLG